MGGRGGTDLHGEWGEMEFSFSLDAAFVGVVERWARLRRGELEGWGCSLDAAFVVGVERWARLRWGELEGWGCSLDVSSGLFSRLDAPEKNQF